MENGMSIEGIQEQALQRLADMGDVDAIQELARRSEQPYKTNWGRFKL